MTNCNSSIHHTFIHHTFPTPNYLRPSSIWQSRVGGGWRESVVMLVDVTRQAARGQAAVWRDAWETVNPILTGCELWHFLLNKTFHLQSVFSVITFLLSTSYMDTNVSLVLVVKPITATVWPCYCRACLLVKETMSSLETVEEEILQKL